MKKIALVLFLFFIVISGAVSCSEDKNYTEIETSPVAMDLTAVPYGKLSDYHFFEGDIKNQTPAYGVIPYKPASELFTDYAKKSRFIWMPNGTKATYTDDAAILDLPVGAALVKNFYYEHVQPENTTKILETRVMIRKTGGWIFAKYVWNDAQTEAFLQTAGSSIPVTWVDDNSQTKSITYEIPQDGKCITCHAENEVNLPIGIKPQNINYNFSYASGTQNQLSKLIEFGYLENNLPASIVSVVDYTDAAKPLDLRIRSYLDSNCAHCHHDGGNADNTVLRFPFSLTENPENMGVCIGTNTPFNGVSHGYIVLPGDTGKSLLHYGLATNNSFLMMPRIGRTVVHEEAVALVGQWISSLPDCE